LPETTFVVRWPDGSTTACYSPSRVVADYLTPATEYSLADFVARSRDALNAASARVARLYGHPCSRAAAQLAHIEATARTYADDEHARVRVETIGR
jgi:uncharacterized repeat protein (TIGR04042 family)